MKISPKMIWSISIFAVIFYGHSLLVFAYSKQYTLGTAQLIIFTAGIAFILMFVEKLWKESTIFELGEHNVKFYRRFFSFSQKNVKYTDIKQVELKQNPIQRFYGIGSVSVTTHATTSNAGIELYDIKEYQEVYEFLLKKIQHN